MMYCKRCLIDLEIDKVAETEDGCEQCTRYLFRKKQLETVDRERFEKDLVNKIKAEKHPKYDCVIGLSGGTDSSYLVHWAHKHQLRALIVHVDNGWNSELSVKNIELLVSKTGFPLKTIVLNWNNFLKIQKAFIHEGLKELEYATDHAIKFGVYKTAKQYGIKHILSGRNLVSEGILPESWSYGPLDKRFLDSVCRKQDVKIHESFPTQGLLSYLIDRVSGKFIEVFPLNYVGGSSDSWQQELIESYGWRKYEQKHFESTWTKFYQGYWLPYKFNIDKRRAHYSVKVLRGEMTREEGLAALQTKYIESNYIAKELDFIFGKLDMTHEDLDAIETNEDLSQYPSHRWFFDFMHTDLYLKIRKYLLS